MLIWWGQNGSMSTSYIVWPGLWMGEQTAFPAVPDFICHGVAHLDAPLAHLPDQVLHRVEAGANPGHRGQQRVEGVHVRAQAALKHAVVGGQNLEGRQGGSGEGCPPPDSHHRRILIPE